MRDGSSTLAGPIKVCLIDEALLPVVYICTYMYDIATTAPFGAALAPRKGGAIGLCCVQDIDRLPVSDVGTQRSRNQESSLLLHDERFPR